MLILGLALAALIGLSLGLLGGGGSILTVPIFVYVLGFAPKQAIAMSLPVVGATSLVGALRGWRAGTVRPVTALLFGAVAMVGAYGGARLAVYLRGELQLVLLAVVMLAAALSMLRSARRPAPPADAETDARGAVARRRALVIPVALGVGLLTGVVGIGGGFLIVPALVLLLRLPMSEAVGTSLLVIALNAGAGFAGHLGRTALPWGFMTLFTLVAIGGLFGGVALSRRLTAAQLKRAFAVFLLVVAAIILVENREVLLGG